MYCVIIIDWSFWLTINCDSNYFSISSKHSSSTSESYQSNKKRSQKIANYKNDEYEDYLRVARMIWIYFAQTIFSWQLNLFLCIDLTSGKSWLAKNFRWRLSKAVTCTGNVFTKLNENTTVFEQNRRLVTTVLLRITEKETPKVTEHVTLKYLKTKIGANIAITFCDWTYLISKDIAGN